MNKRNILLAFAAIIAMATNASVINIHVSPDGNDKAKGTMKSPVRTIARAQQLARACKSTDTVVVVLSDGIYYLDNTLTLTPADNKTLTVYRAEHDGKAIISGGQRLKLKWTPYKDGIYVAKLKKAIDIDQLFINGKRQRMARFPNAVEGKNVYDTWDLRHPDYNAALDALTPEHIARWHNPKGGYIHAMHESLWGDMHWLIIGKNADGTLAMEGGWQNNRPSKMHPVFRFVENIFEELDTPGEWYYDINERKLYFMPSPGTDMKTANVDIVRLTELVKFDGTPQHTVDNVSLRGLVFRHAARTFMGNREPLLRSDWTVSRTAAVLFENAGHCDVTDCEFDQVGGNSILVTGRNKHIDITGCYIHNSGASGVVFVGRPSSVRDALFGYVAQDFSKISHVKGPANDEYPDSCIVDNCLITHTGRDEKQTAGVEISMSHAITVSHCTINGVPRAAVNINEGTFGGHVITHCDLFDTVLETGDHGAFNSWGRDRFWTPDVNQTIPQTNADPALPYLDMLGPNEISYNRLRCDHGWDIDLDDGSTWYNIHHNVLLNGGLKLREGYKRTAWNNVIINNSLNPHVWYSNGGDIFTHNIVSTAYKPAAMTASIADNGKWGKKVDNNFFACDDSQRTAYLKNGCDSNSLSGYPEFVDSINGDYRVKATSPALKMGFENFPMDDFGVTIPSLKAIASKPQLPHFTVNRTATKQKTRHTVVYFGAKLSDATGEELSAFGVPFDKGGIAVVDVSKDSRAAKAGLRNGDLIQQVGNTSTPHVSDFSMAIKQILSTKGKIVLHIVRNQRGMTLTI